MRTGQLNHPDPQHPYNLPTWRKLLMLATVSLTAFAANEMAAAHLTAFPKSQRASKSPSPPPPTPSASVFSVSARVRCSGTPSPSPSVDVPLTSSLGHSTFHAPSGSQGQAVSIALRLPGSVLVSPGPSRRPYLPRSSPRLSCLNTVVRLLLPGRCSSSPDPSRHP